eukprot:1822042-Prymnesium_polylepis.1
MPTTEMLAHSSSSHASGSSDGCTSAPMRTSSGVKTSRVSTESRTTTKHVCRPRAKRCVSSCTR